MTSRHSGLLGWRSSLHAVTGIVLLLAPLCGIATARASDLLGIYFGASYGQAHIRVQPEQVVPGGGPLGSLDMTHSAFQGMVGIRMLSFLGAELTYMDLGTASVNLLNQPVPGLPHAFLNQEQASQKGEAAFALLYLPVPVIDVYVKAGLSRITTDFRVNYTQPLPCTYTECTAALGQFTATRDVTDTSFAYGAGLQWKLGEWALRVEYERFSAAGANPSLASLGMTYWLHTD